MNKVRRRQWCVDKRRAQSLDRNKTSGGTGGHEETGDNWRLKGAVHRSYLSLLAWFQRSSLAMFYTHTLSLQSLSVYVIYTDLSSYKKQVVV